MPSHAGFKAIRIPEGIPRLMRDLIHNRTGIFFEDARLDLLLTTQEVWPETKQTLRVFKNTLPDAGHWIGFRFREAPSASPVGAKA